MHSMADCRSSEDCNSSAEETRTRLKVSRTVVTIEETGERLRWSLLTSGNTAQHPAEWSELGKLRICWCEILNFESRLTKLNHFIAKDLAVEVDPGLEILQPRVEVRGHLLLKRPGGGAVAQVRLGRKIVDLI